MSYIRQTVNQTENVVDPTTGAHTRTMESSDASIKYKISANAAHTDFLCELVSRQQFQNTDLFM